MFTVRVIDIRGYQVFARSSIPADKIMGVVRELTRDFKYCDVVLRQMH